MRYFLAVVLLLTLSGAFSVPASAVPGCFGPLISEGKVVTLNKDGHLKLEDGREVVLSGLRNIRGWTPPAGGRVYLYAFSPKLDRYGHLRAMVRDEDGHWWQRALLQNGQAIVDISTDRYECAAEMYAAEDLARAARRGLWRHSPVYPANRVPGNSRFHIVRGTVQSAKKVHSRVYLNFGKNWRTDFTVTISPEDMKRFRHLHSDPLLLKGRQVEVRGIVQSYHGPEIEMANPFQMRVLP